MSPQDVCRSVAAYHACVALHQQGFIDDDLNPTRTTQQLQVNKHASHEPYIYMRTATPICKVIFHHDVTSDSMIPSSALLLCPLGLCGLRAGLLAEWCRGPRPAEAAHRAHQWPLHGPRPAEASRALHIQSQCAGPPLRLQGGTFMSKSYVQPLILD